MRCLALAAVSAMYIGFYPSIGDSGVTELIDNMPEDLVTGYDRIGPAAGWVASTVYGLTGPALLLVFAIATGARLIAGEEESGEPELELTAPVTRRRVNLERLLALRLDLLAWSASTAGTCQSEQVRFDPHTLEVLCAQAS